MILLIANERFCEMASCSWEQVFDVFFLLS
jgi:hypothetical protein